MQPDLDATAKELKISRAELCRRIGIAPNSGTRYATGKIPMPLTVKLAIAAVRAGLTEADAIPAAA